jgi:ubiquinone/menaquinone biosynthesis C-methylase UbiE
MQIYEAELKASPKQKARKALVKLGLKPYYFNLAVNAEIEDKKYAIYDEPSPVLLAKLLDRVIKTPNRDDRYKLLLEPVPYPTASNSQDKPELWFDYIDGLTSKDIVRGIAETAHHLLPEGRSTWEDAVDLGAGVGYLGAALIGRNDSHRVADSVTLVDISPELLNVAQTRYGTDIQTVQADVTKLPFDDGSFDLAASTGLVYSFGSELQAPYFKEVSRILRPGGIYLDGDYSGGRRYSKARSAARLQLEQLVQMHVSLESPFDPLGDVEDKAAYFDQFGLKLSYEQYKDAQANTDVSIRVLQKTA